MDQSLADIIKTKFKKKPLNKKPGVLKTANRPIGKPAVKAISTPLPTKPIKDARLKIIQKKREQITDARDILVVGRRPADARLKIKAHHPPPLPKLPKLQNVSGINRQFTIKNAAGGRPNAYAYHDTRYENYHPAPPSHAELQQQHHEALRRTIKNNFALPPPITIPPFPNYRSESAFASDPFDVYEVYERRPATYLTEPPPPQHPLVEPMEEDYYAASLPRKGILRAPSRPDPDSAHSRLYVKPDPHKPTGIFSRTDETDRYTPPPPPPNGVRIVVSNLHPSVTQDDIKELFEDIGELMDARLVRSGVAEVVYKRLDDAQAAVETYHNRQLDGLPMKCLLVKPRSSNKPTAPALNIKSYSSSSREVSRRTSSGGRSLELDMDAVHKVLFRR